MPSDWNYHADGVGTAVKTTHDLDGRLKTVRVQLDAFKFRHWTEDVEDIEGQGRDPSKMPYDEEKDAYEEYADGSHATMKFTVLDGVAELSSISSEDSEKIEPRHMMLLRAAERILKHLDSVSGVAPMQQTLMKEYESASEIHIDALDS